MATECTQDAILHFLTGRGGRATNKDLLEHFKPVLSLSSVPGAGDRQKRRATVRETFKGFVDNVAFVKTDDNGVKCVCLKKKYRRLVVKENGNVPGTSGAGAAGTEVTVPGQEEVTVPGQGQEEVTVPGQEEVTVPGQGQEVVTVPGQEEDASRCDNAVEIMGKQQQQQPCATETRSERTERSGGESVTSGEEAHLQQQQQAAQLSPVGSGYGNDTQARRRGETHISPGTILVDSSKEENLNGPQQQQQQPVAVVEEEEEGVASGVGFDDMGNALGFNKSEKSGGGSGGASAERRVRADREPAPDIPQIAIIEASPLPAAADGSMFDLPGHLHQHHGHGGGGGDVHSGTTPEQQGSRRRNSTGSLRSLRSSHPSDEDDESPSRGSLSGSDDNATPRASRQNFIELMMNSSPQVRRSMALRNSVHLSRCKDSSRSDGDDSASLASSMADEDRASVALDPLEHAWMMCASDGEWGGLQHLLADEPALLLRRDFVTGFTCLHWAAKHGRPELLALLVNFAKRHGVAVDVDVRSGAGGYTPLHLAAMHGHADVVKLLVGAYDADVEVRDYSGKKACQYLTGNSTIDIREIAGASSSGGAGDPDSENAVNGAAGTTTATGAGARRRFSNALLHPHLNPLKLHLHHHHHHENEGDGDNGTPTDGQRRSKPVRRKSSLGDRMRPKLQRLRDRTSQIVHSVSFHDAEDLRASRSRGSFKSSSSSRPKSNFLG